MASFPPLLANETVMCIHGGQVDLSGATKTMSVKVEFSNVVLESELMQASITGCPIPPPPSGPGPCTKIVMVPPTALGRNITVVEKGDPPVTHNLTGALTDKGAPLQVIPGGKRTVKFGIQPGVGQACRAALEAEAAFKAAEEDEEGKLHFSQVHWRNGEKDIAPSASIDESVFLSARIANTDAATADIEVWRDSFDSGDNLVEAISGVKLRKLKGGKREKLLDYEWRVVDSDEAIEYFFKVTVDGEESHSSTALRIPAGFAGLEWQDEEGNPATEALVGAPVKLCCDVKRIPDGEAVFLKVWEKDEENRQDLVGTFKATTREGRVELPWEVVYKGRSGSTSGQELAEKGYTIPEYHFRVKYGRFVSEASEDLGVKSWINCTDSPENQILGGCNVLIKPNNTAEQLEMKLNEPLCLSSLPIGKHYIFKRSL